MMRASPIILAGLVALSGYYGFRTGRHRPNPEMAVLPSPPAMTSSQAEEDRRIYLTTRKLAGSLRWQQAVHDARISDSQLIQDFIAAGHIQLTATQEQALTGQLEKLQNFARDAMMREKELWQRRRPYVDYGGESCINDHRRFIPSWSYPSGHTVRGYIIALALAGMFPEHKADLLAKAHDFAESRVICGMHWRSDTEAGAVFASKIFLQADQKQMRH